MYFEKSSDIPDIAEEDMNVLEALITSAEFRLEALERQKQLILGKPSEASVDAQIRREMGKIEELRLRSANTRKNN